MRYTEFRNRIQQALSDSPGMTWSELKHSQDLPYARPCPEWIARLEKDIQLERSERKGNALVWKLSET